MAYMDIQYTILHRHRHLLVSRVSRKELLNLLARSDATMMALIVAFVSLLPPPKTSHSILLSHTPVYRVVFGLDSIRDRGTQPNSQVFIVVCRVRVHK